MRPHGACNMHKARPSISPHERGSRAPELSVTCLAKMFLGKAALPRWRAPVARDPPHLAVSVAWPLAAHLLPRKRPAGALRITAVLVS